MTYKKALNQFIQRLLPIMLLNQELIDRGCLILLPRLYYGGRKIPFVYRIRIVLCLKTECMAAVIMGTALSSQLIRQEIGSVELHARKICVTFHHTAA